MKTKILLSVLAFGFIIGAFSQKPTIELTFIAENNGQSVPLDSIFIENLTQGGDTTLYAPNIVLVLDYVTSIGDNEAHEENSFSVSQNYPNPFYGKTTVDLYLPEKDDIKITVRDILGRELAQYEKILSRGNHSFYFYSGTKNYYLFTVIGKQTSKTIKMLSANNNTIYGGKCKIVYNEHEHSEIGYKSQRLRKVAPALAEKAVNNFAFSLGDVLRYIGYAKTVNEINGSDVIEDAPQTNKIYEFEITEGIPCPDTPTVTYEDQVYNTILIGSQCWFKENLNVGAMIFGNLNQINNGTIQKYCYDDDPENCGEYGGLYQWGEMMQYSSTQGAQGICPNGWHIPSDEEWKMLEGEVDFYFGYPDPEWDKIFWRGFDAGKKLKSTSGWNYNGNGIDSYGFSALPCGVRAGDGFFYFLGDWEYWWSSSEYSATTAWYRHLDGGFNFSCRYFYDLEDGFNVRCLRD